MSEQKFNYKPKEMTQDEVDRLPEGEKQMLVKQVGEDDCIFEKKKGDFGDYEGAPNSIALATIFNFSLALAAATEQGFTHLVFGGLQFKQGSGQITRSPFKGFKKKEGGAATAARSSYTPRVLEEVFVGDWMEVNEKLKDRSQSWSQGSPSVVMGDKFLIVRTR